jgi:NADPH-dependent glutamate synthase beta subunit-like oxidoreductase
MVLTSQQARTEAERCLQCFDAPCIQACPTHIDIPTFISMIKSGNVRGAAEVVKTSNALANVCGKVCPDEIYCQSVCNRSKEDEPIRIRELHFFATQYEARSGYSPLRSFPKKKRRVAVLGGGPTGLGCAFELAKLGYDVTLFDGKGLGGVPKSNIPSFRLADKELKDDVKFLSCHFKVKRVNIDVSKLPRLMKEFDSVYIGIGLGNDRLLGVKGENLEGVFPVLHFLESAKKGKISIGKKVVVVGGGNVSLDAAATARRLGADEVSLIYRRSASEMKVWKGELEEARTQGVEIRFLTNPVAILGKKKVNGVKCRRTELSKKKDSSGRPIPVEVKGSEFTMEADTVVIAIGQVIGADIIKHLKLSKRGFITVDKKFQTSVPGIFAGGDAISGEGTIVQSVAHGKQAAWAINEYMERAVDGAKAT